MKQLLLLCTLVPLLVSTARATIISTPWRPLFKGIEHSAGTNTADAVIQRLSVANCLRVDLQDPDVQLLPSPPNTNNYVTNYYETYALSLSNFLKRHSLAVATVANFYDTDQGSSPTTEGIPATVFGLLVTTGMVVSTPDYGPDSNNRWVSLLFTTNKTPILVLSNGPPGTNLTGIYNAVSGYYPVITNGIVPADGVLSAAYPDFSVHGEQPRTVFGVSQDKRYLYMMTIDGRQSHSRGATSYEAGIWIQYFGAWDAVNMDGGGSAAMYYRDCAGNPAPLGKSSYPLTVNPPRERYTGCHLGIWAPALDNFFSGINATSTTTSASISWNTASNATTQVEYGLSTNFGTFSAYDATPTTNHTVTLTGLAQGTRYYYRILSAANGVTNVSACGQTSFNTTIAGLTVGFPLTATWRYNVANLDGISWTTLGYDDSAWTTGVAPFWADSRANTPTLSNLGIPNIASGTRIGVNPSTTYPYVTHYFRTKFVFSGALAGASLIFSNYIDDGVVFHLNGFEVFRTNMPAGAVFNATTAASNNCPPQNNATCPQVFTLSGSSLSNLVVGTNVVSVELHNILANSADAVYEGALFYVAGSPPVVPPLITNVVVLPGETNCVITWTTISNATSQILYGTTPALGSSTPLDTNLITNHAMVLTNLARLTTYNFRIVSAYGGSNHTYEGTFTTVPYVVTVIPMTNTWRYTTNNVSGTNWTSPAYNDTAWPGQGAGLLYIEDNNGVAPRNTLLPLGGNGFPMPTYYFRTHFTGPASLTGYTLVLSNQVDDGAVFYLNGVEIQRVRMASGPVAYDTLASACPPDNCDSSGEVPDVFRLSGSVLTNVNLGGDNVLAVEVHQVANNSSDVVFGSAASVVRATASETRMNIGHAGSFYSVTWPGLYLTLQHATNLSGTNLWTDIPGPVRISPYSVTNPAGTRFFRLRD